MGLALQKVYKQLKQLLHMPGLWSTTGPRHHGTTCAFSFEPHLLYILCFLPSFLSFRNSLSNPMWVRSVYDFGRAIIVRGIIDYFYNSSNAPLVDIIFLSTFLLTSPRSFEIYTLIKNVSLPSPIHVESHHLPFRSQRLR